MKKKLFLIIAIFLSIAIYSQTPVPEGSISGTWTLEGSPYLIQGETIIDNDSTLIIEPGVLVEWQGSYTMHVQGQILAQGMEADSIIFTAADPDTGFRSIRFFDTPIVNDTSWFEYCIFRYGKVFDPWPENCGGAIGMINFNKIVIDHCLFDHNKAVAVNSGNPGGGAISLYNSSPDIINNTIVQNEAIGEGGGININGESSSTIINTILWGNTAEEGNQVYIWTDDCIPDFFYSDIEGGQDSIGGFPVAGEYRFCIDNDPLFEDPPTGNYHLTANSPCIDAGDPECIDPDGTICDIGAFFYDQAVGTSEFRVQSSGFKVVCYPNPSSGMMNIEYRIMNVEVVQIELFDLFGKEIARLLNKTQTAGEYNLRFDGSDLPAGIYLVRLQAGSHVETTKLVVMR